MTLKLAPKDGWTNFTEHERLSTYLYDTYNDRLHKTGWKYMNFTTDTAFFEDNDGNMICLIYADPDKPILSELIIGIERKINQEQFNVKDVQKELVSRFNLRIE